LISNLSLAIFISISLRILHFSTDKAFPSYANIKSDESSIFEFTNFVGSPNDLKWGSIECENFANVSKPFGKTIVYVATVPPVANSGYSKAWNINLHYY
jgi:hypothetical protein